MLVRLFISRCKRKTALQIIQGQGGLRPFSYYPVPVLLPMTTNSLNYFKEILEG